MKNLWPERFEENTKTSAKNLLEEQAKLLQKITDGIVFAEVVELKPIDATIEGHLQADFCFRFDIVGKFIEGYRFKVLSFSHDITLYPVSFKLDDQLAKELDIAPTLLANKTIDKPEDLEQFLERILKSNRIKNIVGSIMKLSK